VGGRTGEEITAVVADDQQVVREGIKLILEREGDVEIVAEAADVESTGRCVLRHTPTILLLDLNMPGGPTLDQLPRIAAASPQTRTIVVTMEDEPATARRALDSGARGYVLKHAAASDLLEAIGRVLDGGTYVSARLGLDA